MCGLNRTPIALERSRNEGLVYVIDRFVESFFDKMVEMFQYIRQMTYSHRS